MPEYWITADEYLDEPSEVPHSAVETWASDKLSASVQLRCNWSQRHAILYNLLYWGRSWPYESALGMRAVSGGIGTPSPEANLSGFGSSLCVFNEAILTVNFETATRRESDGVIFSEEIAPSAEFLTIPYADFRWGSPDGPALKPEEGPGRLERGLEYIVTFFNLPSIPVECLTLCNTVNDANVTSTSLGLTFNTGTLLFNPPTISRNVTLLEATSRYQIKTRFTHRANGWNKFWRADTQTYEYIYHKDAESSAPYLNFPEADMDDLLP